MTYRQNCGTVRPPLDNYGCRAGGAVAIHPSHRPVCWTNRRNWFAGAIRNPNCDTAFLDRRLVALETIGCCTAIEFHPLTLNSTLYDIVMSICIDKKRHITITVSVSIHLIAATAYTRPSSRPVGSLLQRNWLLPPVQPRESVECGALVACDTLFFESPSPCNKQTSGRIGTRSHNTLYTRRERRANSNTTNKEKIIDT